jgi:hypothetical protein
MAKCFQLLFHKTVCRKYDVLTPSLDVRWFDLMIEDNLTVRLYESSQYDLVI